MAYAALASLAETINLILRYHHDSISPQLENQIKSIHKSVKSLQGFLEDSPDKADWLEGRITEVIHEAEDITEFLLSEQIYESSGGPTRSKFKDPPKGEYEHLRYNFYDLEKVTKKIDSVTEELMGKHQDAVIGLDDLMRIMDRLCGASSKLEVVSIVGMGGIGKTTLARNAYEHPLIMEHFQIRAWVTVSPDYSDSKIVSGLLVSMGVSYAQNDSTNLENVYKTLKGRRYLIVLDDLWSTKFWDDLKRVFPDDDNGSRIMLTTRNYDVASYVDSHSSVHEMRLMDEDQSWILLRQKVFQGGPCPLDLEHIGKMIAKMCRGHLLSIALVSGILAADMTKDAWEDIAENMKSVFLEYHEHLYKIQSLSYTHLPHHLRPCCLYLAFFPEDYEIRVSKLIKLWAAEGFLEPNGRKSLEETAEEYLEDLVRRSLVLVTKRKSDGRIKCVSIHDIVRDLFTKIAHEDDFFLHKNNWFIEGGIKITRRLGILKSDLSFPENFSCPQVRTIVCLEDSERGAPFYLGYFRLLRILDLSNAYDFRNSKSSLLDEIFELFHLRYLALDYAFSIPAAISNLRNLQTLIIGSSNYHEHFVELPMEIWSMPQLRHLLALSCVLPSEEGATFALENLHTLSKAVNLICSKEFLKMIPNVKKLGMLYTMWRGYEDDYQLHNLVHLLTLENLKIEIYNFTKKQHRVSPAFPRTLKKLTLSGLRLPWEDMKIVGSLPNLEVLKLRDDAYIGGTWETSEGEFSQLNFLLIDNSNLVHWITESSHFPKLKSLVLHRCWNLREIPDVGEIPTLELIEVDEKNKSLVHSAKQIQDDRLLLGYDDLQVRFKH